MPGIFSCQTLGEYNIISDDGKKLILVTYLIVVKLKESLKVLSYTNTIF